jgi:hypothetical protein
MSVSFVPSEVLMRVEISTSVNISFDIFSKLFGDEDQYLKV